MTGPKTKKSLSEADFAALLERAGTTKPAEAAPSVQPRASKPSCAGDTSFETLPAYRTIALQRLVSERTGVQNPYYRLHEMRAGTETLIDGARIANFASYDYLGLNGHPEITEAVHQAAAMWGTSVSASRLSAGERPAHRELEAAIADLYEAEDAVAFVSGHATAISTIASLLESRDLILHDALIHNCVVVGARMSGATRRLFAHNDLDALESLLESERSRYGRVLIATEGLFSMDGDGPDLARLIELKERFGCWLLVDDAHGLGVIGKTGRGIFEHLGISPSRVDIWLGTLSKSLVSCGGYVAGQRSLIELLKGVAPGFVYSVGMPVPAAVAALTAIRIMLREPERVARLQANGCYFVDKAKQLGLDVGPSWGYGVVPVLVGDTFRTVVLADTLLARGFNAFPVLPPGVPEKTSRLRFFVCADHSRAQIDAALAATRQELDRLTNARVGVSILPQLITSPRRAAE